MRLRERVRDLAVLRGLDLAVVLQEEGIGIPYPQRTIHVAEGGVPRGAAEQG